VPCPCYRCDGHNRQDGDYLHEPDLPPRPHATGLALRRERMRAPEGCDRLWQRHLRQGRRCGAAREAERTYGPARKSLQQIDRVAAGGQGLLHLSWVSYVRH
jgi:hypothetical protein